MSFAEGFETEMPTVRAVLLRSCCRSQMYGKYSCVFVMIIGYFLLKLVRVFKISTGKSYEYVK